MSPVPEGQHRKPPMHPRLPLSALFAPSDELKAKALPSDQPSDTIVAVESPGPAWEHFDFPVLFKVSQRAVTVIEPASVNLNAFDTKLMSTWCGRSVKIKKNPGMERVTHTGGIRDATGVVYSVALQSKHAMIIEPGDIITITDEHSFRAKSSWRCTFSGEKQGPKRMKVRSLIKKRKT